MEPDNVKNAASGEISKEIGDLNLAYMLLAQKLVKQDRAAAMFRLGVSRELADMLANMSLAQITQTGGIELPAVQLPPRRPSVDVGRGRRGEGHDPAAGAHVDPDVGATAVDA